MLELIDKNGNKKLVIHDDGTETILDKTLEEQMKVKEEAQK